MQFLLQCQLLLSQKAALLPWVCQMFLEAYRVQQGKDVRSVYIEEKGKFNFLLSGY